MGNLLAAHSFRDPETAFRLLKEFAEGRVTSCVAAHDGTGAAIDPEFLALCPGQPAIRNSINHEHAIKVGVRDLHPSDPDGSGDAFGRSLRLTARTALFECGMATGAFGVLLLFDRSEFLAEAPFAILI